MLGFIILFLMIFSIICGAYNGNISAVSNSAVDSCTKAVELVIYLAGSMALWGGLMQIAHKCGITKFIGKILSPLTSLMFADINKSPATKQAVTMNIAANLFGLGNAATPLGISAVKEISQSALPHKKRSIAILVVLNTASIQLIPTTIGSLRLSHGAESPFDVTLPIICVSLVSAFAGCLVSYALYLPKRKKYEGR